MFLSRLSDIVEPRGRTEKDSHSFKKLKISYHKIEILAVLVDLLLIVAAASFGRFANQYIWHGNFAAAQACFYTGIANGVLFVFFVAVRGLYRPPVLLAPAPYFGKLLVSFSSAAFCVAGILFYYNSNMAMPSRPFLEPLLATLFLQITLLIFARCVLGIATRAMLSAGHLEGRRVVTIGEPAELIGLSPSFLLQCYSRTEVFRVPVALRRGRRANEVLAELDRAIATANERGAEEFLVALRWGSQELLETIRSHLRASPRPVRLLPDRNMRSLAGGHGTANGALLAPVTIQRLALTPFEKAVKRVLDVGISMTAIVFFWPLFLTAAAAIKLDSPGPIIFRQRRRGFNGKEFIIYKFRTMTVLEDGPVVTQARRDDLRVTRVGRFLRRSSIDELPQLINVLKGDMSLAGPRPHALAHDEEYRARIADYAFRHQVKPGMTGWAQVNGLRGETASCEQMAERVKLDLWYINNWSLGLDFNILLRTCFEVLRDRAY